MIDILNKNEIDIVKSNLSVQILHNKYQTGFNNFIKKYPEIFNKILTFVNQNKQYESVKVVLQLILENRDLNVCNVCGKQLAFSKSRYKYSTNYCNDPNCLKNKQKVINELRQSNTLKKYGVKHTSALKNVIEKTKQTKKIKYPKQVTEIKKQPPKKKSGGYTFTFSEKA